jgi:23S rRNA pseudouridine2457 synthase
LLLAFNKPYGVLSQFTPDGSANLPLAQFSFPKHVYPIGRLDADSEGLLLHPRRAHSRVYWAQVERLPSAEALQRLQQGLVLRNHKSLPCRAWILDPQPELPPRQPPIRFRKSVPTCWIGLELVEGKNRQVRRMSAAIGHPTLRLIRTRIGQFTLGNLEPGRWRELDDADREQVLGDR